MENQFDFKRIFLISSFFGILAMFLIIPTDSLWKAMLISYFLFLLYQFIHYFISPVQDPSDFSNHKLEQYLTTYKILKNIFIFTVIWTLSSIFGFLFIRDNPNIYLKISFLTNFIFIVFYTPYFTYYLATYTSKHNIISRLYLQRTNLLQNDEIHWTENLSLNNDVSSNNYSSHNLEIQISEDSVNRAQENLVQELTDYVSSINKKLFTIHTKQLGKAIEIFKYIDQKMILINKDDQLKIKQQQQQLLLDLKKITHQYLSIPKDQRHQFHIELNAIPNLMFEQNLKHNLEALIEMIDFLYQDDIKAFKDHQSFFESEFSNKEPDFRVETKSSRH